MSSSADDLSFQKNPGHPDPSLPADGAKTADPAGATGSKNDEQSSSPNEASNPDAASVAYEQQRKVWNRALIDRWNELKRGLQLWVEILEMNDSGEFVPVDVTLSDEADALTGGTYQLRQGLARRIRVDVSPVQNSGTLPIICESIKAISVGSVSVRSQLHSGLNSYQVEGVNELTDKWMKDLDKRKRYLEGELQKIMNKPDKTEEELQLENKLTEDRVRMTEDYNAALVLEENNCFPDIPPPDWESLPGVERHMPTVFLDLNESQVSPRIKEGYEAAGACCVMAEEYGDKMIDLPIVSYNYKGVGAVAAWDSSIHDASALNCVSSGNERIYLIVKVVVRLSQPAVMDLVLRKRVSVTLNKKDILKRISGVFQALSLLPRPHGPEDLKGTGIIYEIISDIPRIVEEGFNRQESPPFHLTPPDGVTTDGGETNSECAK